VYVTHIALGRSHRAQFQLLGSHVPAEGLDSTGGRILRLGPLVTAFIILLAVSFVPSVVAETAVLHLHNSPLTSPAGFIMDEKAPSLTDKGQQVSMQECKSASCTFFGPAVTSPYKLYPGTYAYVIFATGPELTSNLATITIEVFRSASSSFEDIPGMAPKTISGGGCPPYQCIIKNVDKWAVSSEVALNIGDRLAVIVTRTSNVLSVLCDGSQVDPATKQNVFTDSLISYMGGDPDGSPVGGYVSFVNKLDLLAPWLALLVLGVIVGSAVVGVNKKTEKN